MRSFEFTSENGHKITIAANPNSEIILAAYDTGQMDSRAQVVISPELDGQITYDVWRGHRRVTINGTLRAATQKRMDELKNRFRTAFDTKHFGSLIFTNFAGQYHLRCRALSLPTMVVDSRGGLLYKFSVTLEGDAPYFTVYPSSFIAAGTTYLNHRFPWFLPKQGTPFSVFFGDVDAVNSTNINIWPVVEVFDTNSATVNITNDTTGAFLRIQQPVKANQKMVINTAAATAWLYEQQENQGWLPVRSVLNWLSLDSDIKLFFLAPGHNVINVNEGLPTGKPITHVRYSIPAVGV